MWRGARGLDMGAAALRVSLSRQNRAPKIVPGVAMGDLSCRFVLDKSLIAQ